MQIIITLTGPSCSGKSTLAQYLSNHGIPEVQSFTTREPRPGEPTGHFAPYKFVTREWVEALHPDDVIERVEFNGNWYGNTRFMMQRALGRGTGQATVVVEPEGVKHWAAASKKLDFRHFAIYINQSQSTLIRRFSERLRAATPVTIGYEMERMKHMIDVEHPRWPHAFNYDLTVRGLGESSSMSGVTSEMLYGYLCLGLSKTA